MSRLCGGGQGERPVYSADYLLVRKLRILAHSDH